MARIVIHVGGIGRMECDSRRHFWVIPESLRFGLPAETIYGRCPNPEACRQYAAEIERLQKEAQEEAAKKAEASAKKG